MIVRHGLRSVDSAEQAALARPDGDDSPPRTHTADTRLIVRGSSEMAPGPAMAGRR